jgi:MFS family permease
VFLALLGWSGGLVWIAAGYIGLQFTSNIAHGPAQGLLPDKVPADQLGAASGVKNLMDMGGLVVAMLVLGRVLDPEARRLVPAVLFVAGILAFGLVVTLLGVHETPSTSTTSSRPPTSSPTSIPLPSPNVISYWWLIASRFLFLLGIYGIQGFAQYYIRDVMNVANPVKVTGDLLATITLALIAFAVGGGWMGDRIGHKWVLVIASGIGAVGCLLLLAARTPGTLLVYGSVLGAGIGLFLTSNWALANMLAPAEEAGKYLGLSNLATAGAGAVARLAGPLIDLLNNTWPGSFHGYTMLFTFGAVATLVSVTPLRRVHVERKTT